MIAMNDLKSNEAPTEVKCSACNGTGFPAGGQRVQAGRKTYPLALRRRVVTVWKTYARSFKSC
jgi:hypothetical protein